MMKLVLLATVMFAGTAYAQQQPHNPAVRDACAADLRVAVRSSSAFSAASFLSLAAISACVPP
jgi:hypothetical protein